MPICLSCRALVEPGDPESFAFVVDAEGDGNPMTPMGVVCPNCGERLRRPTDDEYVEAQAQVRRITNWPAESWQRRPPDVIERENDLLDWAKAVIAAYGADG